MLGEYSKQMGFKFFSSVDDKSYGFECLRPCPNCQTKMRTNGKGLFICPECGYNDHQNIDRIRRRFV